MDDAVFAFHLYEESVFSRSGYSYLGLVPLDNILELSLNKVLGREKNFSMRELEAFFMEYSVDEGYSGRWWSEGVGSGELVAGRRPTCYWRNGGVGGWLGELAGDIQAVAGGNGR